MPRLMADLAHPQSAVVSHLDCAVHSSPITSYAPSTTCLVLKGLDEAAPDSGRRADDRGGRSDCSRL